MNQQVFPFHTLPSVSALRAVLLFTIENCRKKQQLYPRGLSQNMASAVKTTGRFAVTSHYEAHLIWPHHVIPTCIACWSYFVFIVLCTLKSLTLKQNIWIIHIFLLVREFSKGTPTDRLMAAPSTFETEWKKKSLRVGKKRGKKNLTDWLKRSSTLLNYPGDFYVSVLSDIEVVVKCFIRTLPMPPGAILYGCSSSLFFEIRGLALNNGGLNLWATQNYARKHPR